LNIPTLIFWNSNHWEIRNDAKPYFQQLEAAGILHRTPESAARLLAQVWDDVKSWWEGSFVQDARREFCKRYSCRSEGFTEKLAILFRGIVPATAPFQSFPKDSKEG
jgi:putative transferase (TIGR04331 family)